MDISVEEIEEELNKLTSALGPELAKAIRSRLAANAAQETGPQPGQSLDSVAREAFALYRQRCGWPDAWERLMGTEQSAWREVVGLVLSKARVSL